jgi:hypothetical protein
MKTTMTFIAIATLATTARKLLFTVGAHEGLKSGSETGRKGVVFLGASGLRIYTAAQWFDFEILLFCQNSNRTEQA